MPEHPSDSPPTAQQLDHLVFELLDPIHRLDDGSRQRLLKAARHFRLGPGQLLDPDETAGLILYLMQGGLERTLPDGALERIDEGHRHSVEPLIPEGLGADAHSRTRLRSLGRSEVIGFDRALYTHLMDVGAPCEEPDDLVLKGPEGTLFKQLMDDFHHDRLQVPHLPALAGALTQRLQEDPDDSDRLVRLIEGQPALAIAVTRAGGTSSIPAALIRLGPERVRGLVGREALRLTAPDHSPLVQERLLSAHRHSVQVAAFSHIIAARHGRLDPDKALLCGLLHDVGTFAVLCRAEALMDRFGTVLALDAATRRLHGVIGGLMLGRWGYDHDVVRCAEAADDWKRDPGPELDYADIVLVAQLHSFLGSSRAHWLPQFNAVPAFAKLAGGDPSPALSRWLLSQGRRRIQELESLLAGASAPA
jgi:HD-like signal output (HDOD) protein